MKKYYFFLLITLCSTSNIECFITLISPSDEIPGENDDSFGPDNAGFVVLQIGSGSQANAVSMDQQKRILLAGAASNGSDDFSVARFSPNGITDLDFGSLGTGFTLFDFSGAGTSTDTANAMVVDDQSRSILAGTTDVNGTDEFGLVRIDTAGIPDPSFGPNNNSFTTFGFGGGATSEAHAMVFDNQGRLLVGGFSDINGSNDFAIVGFSSDGILDTSFGPTNAGFVLLDFSGDNTSNDRAFAMIIDNQGRIILAGRSDLNGGNSFAIARFSSNGIVDLNFGPDGTGFVLVDFSGDNSSNDFAFGVALDHQGRILVAGESNALGTVDFALTRLSSSGILDTTFGPNQTGRVIIDFDQGVISRDVARAIALDSQQRIILAGFSDVQAGAPINDFALVRLLQDGDRDIEFGPNKTGIVLFDFSSDNTSDDRGFALDQDSQGRILVAGFSNVEGNNSFALARFFGEQFLSPLTLAIREKYCT